MIDLETILSTAFSMGVVYSLVVLSLGISFRLLNFPDLTIDGSFALGGAIAIKMYMAGFNLLFIIVVVAIAGVALGTLASVLYSQLNIDKFLVGIILSTAMYSIIVRVLGSGFLGLGSKFTFYDSYKHSANYVLSILVILISFLFYLLFNTRYGVKVRAACMNEKLAYQAGLSPALSFFLGLACVNMLASVSGFLFSMRLNHASTTFLYGTLMISLASLTIGEYIIPSKRINRVAYVFFASIGGCFIYQLVWVFMEKANLFKSSDLNLITSIVIIGLFIVRRQGKRYD